MYSVGKIMNFLLKFTKDLKVIWICIIMVNNMCFWFAVQLKHFNRMFTFLLQYITIPKSVNTLYKQCTLILSIKSVHNSAKFSEIQWNFVINIVFINKLC